MVRKSSLSSLSSYLAINHYCSHQVIPHMQAKISLRAQILEYSGRILQYLSPKTPVVWPEDSSPQGRILQYSGPKTMAERADMDEKADRSGVITIWECCSLVKFFSLNYFVSIVAMNHEFHSNPTNSTSTSLFVRLFPVGQWVFDKYPQKVC